MTGTRKQFWKSIRADFFCFLFFAVSCAAGVGLAFFICRDPAAVASAQSLKPTPAPQEKAAKPAAEPATVPLTEAEELELLRIEGEEKDLRYEMQEIENKTHIQEREQAAVKKAQQAIGKIAAAHHVSLAKYHLSPDDSSFVKIPETPTEPQKQPPVPNGAIPKIEPPAGSPSEKGGAKEQWKSNFTK